MPDTNFVITLVGIGLNAALTGLVGLGLNVINNRAIQREEESKRAELARSQKIAGLETKLEESVKGTHELATKLVDERFRGMTHEVKSHMQGLLSTIDEMKLRLRDGETQFANIHDGGHALKLEITKGLAEIKQVVTEKAASKQDLKEHQSEMTAKVKEIQTHLGQQDVKHAQLAQRVEDVLKGK